MNNLNIEVIITPEEIKDRILSDKLIVVIDVLRASSTIITALAKGCRGFIPIFSPNQAIKEAKQLKLKKEDVLLGGERDGEKIEGFHLGNSPREYQKNIIQDKIIIFSTTNGVKTFELVKNADKIIIASFLNLQAVSKYCSSFKKDVLLVCAGREGKLSLEDTVCTGMLFNSLKSNFSLENQKKDSNLIAQLLCDKYRNKLMEMFNQSQHGRYLKKIGLEADLEFCAQLNIFNIIPVFKNNLITLE